MNMNVKDWDNEFWDDEAEADDDEEDGYNGLATDIDANNDETFDNAAEWNEDEHEELIARDSILSQPSRIRNNNNHARPSNNNVPNNSTTKLAPPEPGPQILMVDELEGQLRKTNINQGTSQPLGFRLPEISKRAGWSPFGGKDLFTTLNQNLPTAQGDFIDFFHPAQQLDPEQQQRLILQQHQLLQRQQQQLQLQQFALLQQQHLQQQQQQQQLHQQQRQQQQQQHHQQQQQLQPTLLPPNAKCMTVEELERQILTSNKANKTQETESKNKPPVHYALLAMAEPTPRAPKSNESQRNFGNERRNGERPERFNKLQREAKDSRDHRERRDYKGVRDNRYRREPIIIPPQVQRSVIEKAKRLHSIPKIDSGEFLQDRMPIKGEGFSLKKHSKVASEKVNHDGVLTEKERNWLTRIQEKIQADYDDKLDQDYYYLLYFNRSSMKDEAAQRPMGPGCLDRRFIPRERLLYNSGI